MNKEQRLLKREQPLLPIQTEFLQARGFRAIYDAPTPETPYAYFILRDVQQLFLDSEIEFHTSSISKIGTAGVLHPSNCPLDDLLLTAEHMAAEMTWKGELMPDREALLPLGKPISMYVLDRTWDPVVNTLIEKYKQG